MKYFTTLFDVCTTLHLAAKAGLFGGKNELKRSKYGSFGKQNLLYEPTGAGVTVSDLGELQNIDIKGIVYTCQDYNGETGLLYYDENVADDVEIMFTLKLLFAAPDTRYLVHIAVNKSGWILCGENFQPISNVKVELSVEIGERIENVVNYYLKCRKESRNKYSVSEVVLCD